MLRLQTHKPDAQLQVCRHISFFSHLFLILLSRFIVFPKMSREIFGGSFGFSSLCSRGHDSFCLFTFGLFLLFPLYSRTMIKEFPAIFLQYDSLFLPIKTAHEQNPCVSISYNDIAVRNKRFFLMLKIVLLALIRNNPPKTNISH